MKIKVLLLTLFVAGFAASMALASPPPWSHAGGKGNAPAAAPTNGTTTTTSGKVLMCHRTGSAKHPYVLISVSVHSAHARGKHKGDLPATGGSCPMTPPGTPTTASTSTATTTTD
jgi:hypothetical protein